MKTQKNTSPELSNHPTRAAQSVRPRHGKTAVVAASD